MKAWKQYLEGYQWLVHQVWYLEVEHGEVIDPKPHLIPNPRAHLLFTPSDQDYSYDSGDTKFIGKGAHLLTANEHLLLLEDKPPIKRIGTTFRPEGLYTLQSIAGQRVDVAAINQCQWFDWLTPLFGDDFQQQLWQQPTRALLVEFLGQHFDSLSISPSAARPYVVSQQAIHQIDEQALRAPEKVLDIEEVAKQCACSRRTLERSFKQVVGLSVKQYQQMARLEQMILALYQQESTIDWASFSQAFGFSDQSHLIRTLKQQLNKTPNKYLSSRDLTIDVYGDFES